MTKHLLRPIDPASPEHDLEECVRLKDPHEFDDPADWVLYQAKVFYEGFKDLAEATRILEEGMERHPENSEIILSLAECYSRGQETLEKAIELCDKGLAQDPRSDYAYTIKARSQHELKRPIDAYISAMRALKINAKNFEAGVYLSLIGFAIAEAESNLEEMEYSVENMRIAARMNPGSQWFAGQVREHEEKLAAYKR